VFYIV